MPLTIERPTRARPAVRTSPTIHRFTRTLSTDDPAVRRWSIATGGSPDPITLARLFDRTVRPAFPSAGPRDADYWSGRYIDGGTPFHRFGGPATGAVVVRVERLDGSAVLQLAELLPSSPAAWDGAGDPTFTRMLGGVLAWATARGCVAAEHRCRSARAGHLLAPLGFGGAGRSPRHIDPRRIAGG